MNPNRTCAGCLNVFSKNESSQYRRKSWCGSVECQNIIDEKVKHKNFKRKEKKIKNGTWRNGVSQEHRFLILDRDDHRCCRCKFKSYEIGEMQVHHIIPVSEGGSDDNINLITLCKHCHTKVHQIGWEGYVESFTKITEKLEENNKAR